MDHEAYQQARADVLEAQLTLQAAQKRLEESVKVMQVVCLLTQDAQGKIQYTPEKPKAAGIQPPPPYSTADTQAREEKK